MRMSRSSASECSLSAGGVVALQQMADVQQQVKVEHHGHAHGHAHHLNAVSGLWASANTSSSVMAAANMAQAQDVTNLQYMDLEEFFLDHLTPVDNSRGVFAEPYQISLEQRHHDAAVNMIVSSSPSSTSSSASPPTQSFAQMHHMLSPSSAQPVQGSQNSMLPMSPVQSVQSLQSVQGSQKHVLLQQHDLVGVDLDAKLLPPIRTLARTQSVQDNTAHKSSPHSHSRRLSHQSEMPRRTSSSSLSTPPESPESFDSSDHSSRLGVASPVGNEPGARPRKAVKRSRKESVPEESKDEKYWKRRAKNNEAAKRSRDLRREKENQIMTRVNMLERENQLLSQQLRNVRSDNDELRKRLQKYEVLSI